MRLWDVRSHRRIGGTLTGHRGPVNAVTFTRGGAVIATAAGDDTVRLWSTGLQNKIGQPLTTGTKGFWTMAASPDGRTLIAGGGHDGSTAVWRLTDS
ncbi:hypothetical protein [Cryptosporangium sp. NPDC048952]|uniref:hypothetical protein n=1 Tax=Cryptosporangium sp. NPDC048952 TaxID=3363961 RepID=UPI00371B4EC6